uniref:Uncharacterized protein n=1 Tax=Cacopsylla melanoneura TaxID=428564 RepID=A0A8D8QQ65_9HEMI
MKGPHPKRMRYTQYIIMFEFFFFWRWVGLYVPLSSVVIPRRGFSTPSAGCVPRLFRRACFFVQSLILTCRGIDPQPRGINCFFIFNLFSCFNGKAGTLLVNIIIMWYNEFYL